MRKITKPILAARREVKGTVNDVRDLINDKAESVRQRWTGSPAQAKAKKAVDSAQQVAATKQRLKQIKGVNAGVKSGPIGLGSKGRKIEFAFGKAHFAEFEKTGKFIERMENQARAANQLKDGSFQKFIGPYRAIYRKSYEAGLAEKKLHTRISVGSGVAGAAGIAIGVKKARDKKHEFSEVPFELRPRSANTAAIIPKGRQRDRRQKSYSETAEGRRRIHQIEIGAAVAGSAGAGYAYNRHLTRTREAAHAAMGDQFKTDPQSGFRVSGANPKIERSVKAAAGKIKAAEGKRIGRMVRRSFRI
jgi:hypothetical protein